MIAIRRDAVRRAEPPWHLVLWKRVELFKSRSAAPGSPAATGAAGGRARWRASSPRWCGPTSCPWWSLPCACSAEIAPASKPDFLNPMVALALWGVPGSASGGRGALRWSARLASQKDMAKPLAQMPDTRRASARSGRGLLDGRRTQEEAQNPDDAVPRTNRRVHKRPALHAGGW